MKKEKTFIIIGGKWHDAINGNTYHNAKIIDPLTGIIYYSGFQYGYGSQYLTTGKEYINSVLKIDNVKIIDGGSFFMKKAEIKNGWF